jgi:hypothetical protein
MPHTAKTQPGHILCGLRALDRPEVKLTIEQSLPGHLSPSDWPEDEASRGVFDGR